MCLLIDKCIDERPRNAFPDHECQTARFAGLAGLKNGKLLDAAEAAGFDVLLTVDQHIPEQQNFEGRRIAVLILIATTNKLRDLQPLVPRALGALDALLPGQIVRLAVG